MSTSARSISCPWTESASPSRGARRGKLAELARALSSAGVSLERVARADLDRLSAGGLHQGVVVINSSPSVLGNTLSVGSADGFLYALDARTGVVLWGTNTEGAVDSRGSSPRVGAKIFSVPSRRGGYSDELGVVPLDELIEQRRFGPLARVPWGIDKRRSPRPCHLLAGHGLASLRRLAASTLRRRATMRDNGFLATTPRFAQHCASAPERRRANLAHARDACAKHTWP